MNIDAVIIVIGSSVTGLGGYCPCQWTYLFGGVGSMSVFESKGHGFNPRPGIFFLCNIITIPKRLLQAEQGTFFYVDAVMSQGIKHKSLQNYVQCSEFYQAKHQNLLTNLQKACIWLRHFAINKDLECVQNHVRQNRRLYDPTCADHMGVTMSNNIWHSIPQCSITCFMFPALFSETLYSTYRPIFSYHSSAECTHWRASSVH